MEIREELTRFVAVLVEDTQLRAWFESFTDVSPGQRQAEFTSMAADMRAAGEDPELIRATALLAHGDVFEAVRQTLREISEDRLK